MLDGGTPITREAAAAEYLARLKAQSSLRDFAKYAWPQIEGARELVWGWHLDAKCEHLEAVTRGEITNLLINEPPRSMKSVLINIMWPTWVWINDPSVQWLFSSYSFSLTTRDAHRQRTLINSNWFRTRWQEKVKLLDDATRLDRFINNNGGYRLSTSVDSGVLGDGSDITVVDDPNNTRDQSDTMLDSVIQWWTNVMPSRKNSFLNHRRVVIQQRTHERDLSGHILANDKENWVHLMLPLEFEEARRCKTVILPSSFGKIWEDPRKKEGELLDPLRRGPKEVKQLKKDLSSEYAIAGQLQQRPAPEAGGIIRKAWFSAWKSQDPPKIEYTLLSVDTALSEKKGAAFSAATTWGVFHDRDIPQVILLSSWRERCEYPELRERMQRMAADYLDDAPGPGKDLKKTTKRKPDIVLIEAKANGLSLIQDLRRGGVFATPFDPSKLGDKLQRVRLITPLIESGRVWMPALAPDYKRFRTFADFFVEQAASFPNAASRDMVDTCSQALWWLQSRGFVWHPADPRAPEYSRVGSGPQSYY